MDSSTFEPTEEQQAIIDACAAGKRLVIEAGAGTGKTSTLKLAAAEMPGNGIYIAYNRAIATEAKASFPQHVRCATAHSLAFAAVGRQYARRLTGPRMPARESAKILGVTEPAVLGTDLMLPPHQVTRIALATVNRYCQSADAEIHPGHVPAVPGVPDEARQDLTRVIVPLAQRAWADLCRKDGQLKFQHDHYLKMWQLTGPQLPADFVLFDEAQDANPVIASIVQQQPAQRVAVGDSCQQLYAWRGAVDALSQWEADQRLYLSQSWRFGPAVADEANKWLGVLRAPLRLHGTSAIASTVANEVAADAILCRTNAYAVSQAMRTMAAGRRAALVGGSRQIRDLATAAQDLHKGKGTNHPELFIFTSWGEVQDYVTHDEAGADLRAFVQLIDTYGADVVLDAVDRLVDEPSADVVISTAHKAKGREWTRVAIGDDFPAPQRHDDGSQDDMTRAEAMLAYVAVTRAREQLGRGGLSWIDTYLASRQHAA